MLKHGGTGMVTGLFEVIAFNKKGLVVHPLLSYPELRGFSLNRGRFTTQNPSLIAASFRT